MSCHPFLPHFSVKYFVKIAKKIAEEPKVTQFFGTFWSCPKKFTTVYGNPPLTQFCMLCHLKPKVPLIRGAFNAAHLKNVPRYAF